MKTFLESINAAAKYPMWILTAIRENKPIECRMTKGGTWVNCISIYDGNYSPDEFEYRIKPAAPTLRPWRPEEVPVGALIRNKNRDSEQNRYLIIAVNGDYVAAGRRMYEHLNVLFNNSEHSLDHGKTWLPCGVVAE